MISGQFRDEAPRAILRVTGERSDLEVEFIVDTGYTGYLALPSFVLERIGATPDGVRLLQLADGTERRVISYLVEIEWDEEPRAVRATALEDEPLIGVALLHEYHLHIELTEGGEVVAEPL